MTVTKLLRNYFNDANLALFSNENHLYLRSKFVNLQHDNLLDAEIQEIGDVP